MKVAIITPGIQPVPALNGGAVETLIEELISQNELYKNMEIDLYTIPDKRYDKNIYKHCNIIEVKTEINIKLMSYIKKIVCKLLRIQSNFTIDSEQYTIGIKKIMSESEKVYDCILLENNMQIYKAIKDEIKKHSKKFVFHLHNEILGSDRPSYLCKEIIEEAYAILSVSNYLKERMNSVMYSEKNKVFYNCVNLETFNPQNINYKKVSDWKQKLEINERDFSFLFTGRITDDKGILELVKAFGRVLDNDKNVKLIIVGNSWFGKKRKNKFEKRLEKLVKKIGEKVVFTGYIEHNDIPQILSIADCVVIPSKWEEPFGVVGIEAMAMQKKIIATNSGGLKEQLDENTAIMVNKDENMEKNLERAMNEIKDNNEYAENLAKNAYEKVHNVKDFNNKFYYQNFIKFLN